MPPVSPSPEATTAPTSSSGRSESLDERIARLRREAESAESNDVDDYSADEPLQVMEMPSEHLSKADYGAFMAHAKKNGAAVRASGKFLPCKLINTRIKQMQHELIALIQRNSNLWHLQTFHRSAAGKEIAALVKKLFSSESPYSYSSAKLLQGSKESLQVHLQNQRKRENAPEFFNFGGKPAVVRDIPDPMHFNNNSGSLG